jgi:hypothetical protein
MLQLATPATPSYIPPIRPIHFVLVRMVRQNELTGQYLPLFSLLDQNKNLIVFDPTGLPQQPPQVTPAQQAAFAAYAATAGQTPNQVISAAWISAVTAIFGLTGLSVV